MDYHWIVTLQFPVSPGGPLATQTLDGTCPALGSRSAALEGIRKMWADKGIPPGANVLFFSYEPNET